MKFVNTTATPASLSRLLEAVLLASIVNEEDSTCHEKAKEGLWVRSQVDSWIRSVCIVIKTGILAKIEGVTGKRSSGYDQSNQPFDKVWSKICSERLGRSPELGPGKYALSPTFSDHMQVSDEYSHKTSKSAKSKREIWSTNCFTWNEASVQKRLAAVTLVASNFATEIVSC